MERENMVQDLSMLQEFYEAYAAKIGRIREKLARPLTYAEKILYTKQNTFYDINNNVMYVQNKNKGVDLGKDGEYGFEKMVILKVFEYLR